MKKLLLLFVCTLLSLSIGAADKQSIRINTDNIDLILQVSPKNRLYQVYLGEKLNSTADFDHFNWNIYAGSDGAYGIRGREAYPGSGGEDMFEPALAITHADGNQTTYLYYKKSTQKAVPGGTETIIELADDKYAVQVTLHYVAYMKENVIKTWSEIKHNEKSSIILWRYASGMFYFNSSKYFLTNYHSDWAREGQPAVQQLQFGKKIVDTKLGTRAAEQSEPFFEIGFDQPAQENQGRVMLGTIGWTGNFSFTFEIDNVNCLRVIPAINSYASNYKLKAGENFKTPEFIFTLSENGTGQASRNLQNWARRYQLWNGEGNRMTLLNNWENTAFDFTQETLALLMKDAKELGVDMFLLDDGWFGNKYPRKDDRAGLGDWEPTRTKLPGGIPALTKATETAGVKFGLWIEPEMVNPKSELYEKHKNWVIELPNRETYYYRHQLVLDLSNPEVQDYVFSIVDRLMTENPSIVYFKWDCNSPITNIYSPYQKANQGNLYIEYVRGLYKVLDRIQAKYPKLEMMLCSGGGGRCDYQALKYYGEFWPSDDTDPYERLYIQYSMSKFFPSKALAAHVTNWNRRTSIKFRTDVASMCKLGFDLDLKTMKPEDYKFTQDAVTNWNRLKNVILDGELYRLISPYETHHMAVNYVSQDKKKAVLFAYDLHPRYSEPQQAVRLQGLDANRTYTVKEINLMPNTTSALHCNGQRYTGDYLMKVGLMVLSAYESASRVLELTAE
ncbi:alpha-galactosidase [Prevotella fusca JCM 17724]|uniref:Alpha-galactosidase n=1 Tax=Prevotella fusca JCM 17724 TaxID=1236517 RepID=A0A0K1NJP7_9BACT|nr:alpha-galactosidase [Prevotella fusca]AKU69250.1 alpha-galactosidase [Prevotella fusca JCM 17724]QUB86880.1 alpha-galactosidase [Prevotella fusca JCM 17724]